MADKTKSHSTITINLLAESNNKLRADLAKADAKLMAVKRLTVNLLHQYYRGDCKSVEKLLDDLYRAAN